MSDEALAAVFIIAGTFFAFWLYILLPANWSCRVFVPLQVLV